MPTPDPGAKGRPLTEAELGLLRDLLAKPQIVSCGYAPGAALIKLGLATGENDSWGHSRLLNITEFGRLALTQSEPKDEPR